MNTYLINWYTDNQHKDEITSAMLSMIEKAERCIKIGNFIFEYTPVIDALEEALKRGVAVFILSNVAVDQKSGNEYKAHIDNLLHLASKGAHVRYLEDLHAKFVIRDDAEGMVTSANLNANSMGRNSETGVMLTEAEIKTLNRLYSILYLKADITHMSKEGRFQHKTIQRTAGLNIDPNELIASRLRVTLTSKKDTNLKDAGIRHIYDETLRIIDAAQEYCYIVTWHFGCKKGQLQPFVDSLI